MWDCERGKDVVALLWACLWVWLEVCLEVMVRGIVGTCL